MHAGGLDREGRYHNDAFVLDTKRQLWFPLTVKGAPPKPRAYHSWAPAPTRSVTSEMHNGYHSVLHGLAST